MKKFKVVINGQEREILEGTTLQDIVNELNINNSMFVVEKNLEIIPKEQLNQLVTDGDCYEIVAFFGGG